MARKSKAAPSGGRSALRRTRNDLDAGVRERVIGELQPALCDAIDLYTHLKQAHWTVRGPSFIAVHELLDSLADNARGHADHLAERIMELGGQAAGTAAVVAESSRVAPYPTDVSDWREHLDAVCRSLAAFGAIARRGIDATDRAGDKDTADLFTEISRAADHDLWLVEAHLED